MYTRYTQYDYRADLSFDVQLLQLNGDVGDVGRWAGWWAVIRTR